MVAKNNFVGPNRVALVTGSAKRLGAAVARALAARGVDLALHYRHSREEAEALAQSLETFGVRTVLLQGDLAVAATARQVFEEAAATLGAVDILINNASIFPADRLDAAGVESVHENVDINALAPMVLGQCMAAQQRPGAIINFLDTRIQDYDHKHVSYHLSKRMLYTLTRMQAVEYAPEIRVNGVAPGLVLPPAGKDESYLQGLADTNPLQCYGGPSDIVDAVCYLLDAMFVTGQVLYVDGGRNLRGAMYT